MPRRAGEQHGEFGTSAGFAAAVRGKRSVEGQDDRCEWRMWINVHMNHFRHGIMLEDLGQPVRDLALGIVQATLSARGYHQARSIMRLNQLLADVTGDHEAFGEWPYSRAADPSWADEK